VDASNGNENKYFAAKASINASWDLDKEKERMFVVGDTGMANLFLINEKQNKWTEIKKWSIHNIMTYENNYVCMVKASPQQKLFITATINGNVKIWSKDGDYLADLNQKDWPSDIQMMSKE